MDKRHSSESPESAAVPRAPASGSMYRRAEMRAHTEAQRVAPSPTPQEPQLDVEVCAAGSAAIGVVADAIEPSLGSIVTVPELEPTVSGSETPALAQPWTVPPPPVSMRRRRTTAAVVLLIFVGIVWLARRSGPAPTEEAVQPQDVPPAVAAAAPAPGAGRSTQTPVVGPAAAPTLEATQAAERPQPATPTPRPRAAEPALLVTSEPAGARVTVNGIGWGTTPVTVRYLPPGAKRIRVTKDGYLSQERVVTIGDNGSRVRVQMRLRARSAQSTSASALQSR